MDDLDKILLAIDVALKDEKDGAREAAKAAVRMASRFVDAAERQAKAQERIADLLKWFCEAYHARSRTP